MGRTLWNSLIQLLARIIPPKKMRARATVAGSVVYRRVEVTVERESVSMWVGGSSAGGAEEIGTVNASPDRSPISHEGSKGKPTASKRRPAQLE